MLSRAIANTDDPMQNPYEVTTEDKVPSSQAPAQISLTDCLACSGCVTSAEAVLVSLQSHLEVLNALSSYRPVRPHQLSSKTGDININGGPEIQQEGRLFVASVSPQSRASIAATFGVSEKQAGYMIQQMLAGSRGIRQSRNYGEGFTWVVDTNVARELCLVLGSDEVLHSLGGDTASKRSNADGSAARSPDRPILTSACPGWICYAEKTHPHVLRHLSRLKSPQALLGTLLKTTLSRRLGISPDRIWHLAIMPCFDKKLEASREELTDAYWEGDLEARRGTRDVDCVITTKELLMLAESIGVRFPELPRQPLSAEDQVLFPDEKLHYFLVPRSSHHQRPPTRNGEATAGTSGGYLHHILHTFQSQHPGSHITTMRGRNADIVEQNVVRNDEILLRTARYYGFRNIQNLVRKLKPPGQGRMPRMAGSRAVSARSTGGAAVNDVAKYAYVEVMACPGGCTNGGGQIKAGEVSGIRSGVEDATEEKQIDETKMPLSQKEWQAQVDEAYFSASDDEENIRDTTSFLLSSDDPTSATTTTTEESLSADYPINGQRNEEKEGVVNGISIPYTKEILHHWSTITNIPLDKLVYTSYRVVESDVGKSSPSGGGDSGGNNGEKGMPMAAVVESIAGRIGGGVVTLSLFLWPRLSLCFGLPEAGAGASTCFGRLAFL